MVVRSTTLPVIVIRMVCLWGPPMPERDWLLRDMEEWAYSKKAITVEMILNIVIFLLSVLLLVCTAAENPNVPVRVWVSGHAIQCLLHVICVWYEYHHVSRRSRGELQDFESYLRSLLDASLAYLCDCFNMSASFVWLNLGLYWIQLGDKLLPQNAPWLYWWMTRAYLPHDISLAMIWLVGITVLSCLPRSILIQRYRWRTVAGQNQVGVLEPDLNVLPNYRFRMYRNLEKPSAGAGVMVPMDISSGSGAERVVLSEDSECCICLCSYDDGVELHALRCNHHFHATCVQKWLKINANCPVCKYNILTRSVQV